jgi:carboxymethylenebutenolidase
MKRRHGWAWAAAVLFLGMVSGLAEPVMGPPRPPAAQEKLRGKVVSLSDFGSEDVGYLSLPMQPPAGGVVVLHEWWGLNEATKRLADRLADEGFVAIAVDLYNGQVANNPTRAATLMEARQDISSLKTVRAGIRLLKESPKFKVPTAGTLGLGMGGGISLRAARQVKGVDCAVMFYGPVEMDDEPIARIAAPVCGIFAIKDAWIPIAEVEAFAQRMQHAERPLEIHRYEAEHGFASLGNAKYHAANAAKAWAAALDFLRRELAKPPRSEGDGLLDKVFKKKDVVQ